MSHEELFQGNLSEKPLWDVFAQIRRVQASGCLCIGEAGREARLYLSQGKPFHLKFEHSEKPLGHLLLELGWIDSIVFTQGLRRIVLNEERSGDVFQELAGIDDQQLQEILVHQSEQKLASFCRTKAETFRLNDDVVDLSTGYEVYGTMNDLIFLALQTSFSSVEQQRFAESLEQNPWIFTDRVQWSTYQPDEVLQNHLNGFIQNPESLKTLKSRANWGRLALFLKYLATTDQLKPLHDDFVEATEPLSPENFVKVETEHDLSLQRSEVHVSNAEDLKNRELSVVKDSEIAQRSLAHGIESSALEVSEVLDLNADHQVDLNPDQIDSFAKTELGFAVGDDESTVAPYTKTNAIEEDVLDIQYCVTTPKQVQKTWRGESSIAVAAVHAEDVKVLDDPIPT